MLKTRAMFPLKDHQSLDHQPQSQSDLVGLKPITNHPLSLSLLIGLNNNKCISDSSDFVRSPKSPLEFRMLSTMAAADPFFLRSSSLTPPPPHLNCCCRPSSAKVGLSIVDDRSLLPDVVFGPALRIKCSKVRDTHHHRPKLLFPVAKKIEKERSGVVFEIGDDNSSEAEQIGLRNRSFSANDCLRKTRVLSGSKLGVEGESGGSSDNAFSSCLSEDDMEDYTCIIAHGPNPKTTHIYGDRVLECHKNESKGDDDDSDEKHIETQSDSMLASVNFLSVCNFCNKKLEGGEDIYMYREKPFCSAECRSEEMVIDEDMEDPCIVMHESLKKLF
ncbi:PREDICTED: protein MARD1-like [Camelina sativa]|uniref:Protein MARD1-like n=1 Tax=Camelina sativa TaxID=90675 RepID=A0ABM0TQ32_CAMSA|nr:PREDICTED: protein MARD1-like [Camelina sativa]XP_010429572.1 PREDICTED: protein MARD1-like [Camelina sativa]